MDLGVRDGDHPGVGGNGDLVIRGAEQLAGEAAVPVVLAAGAHARTAADVTAEVVRLGERALRPRRGHLERVGLAHAGQVLGHALAEGERDPVGVIDEQPHHRAVDDLGEKNLDRGLDVRELLLDVGLDRGAHRLFPPSPLYMKKAGQRPLSALRLNESFAVTYSTGSPA